jgi:hypothetical protein
MRAIDKLTAPLIRLHDDARRAHGGRPRQSDPVFPYRGPPPLRLLLTVPSLRSTAATVALARRWRDQPLPQPV